MTLTHMTIRRIMVDSLRLYFAPLTGAYRGIRAEFRRLDRDIEQRRKEEYDARQARTA